MDAWDAAGIRALADALDAVLAFRHDRLENATDIIGEVAALMEAAGRGDPRQLMSSPSTIHVSAVDETGLTCSITSSAGYGSGAMIPGTGIMLNNSLGEVELHPAGLHAFDPGTRLPSNMAPTVAYNGDEVLAVGSPGADRITSAVVQTVFNYLRLGMPLEMAVSHPRLHVETFEGKRTLAHEPGVDVSAVDHLAHRPFSALSMYFGGVQAAARETGGNLVASADSRRTGGTAYGG